MSGANDSKVEFWNSFLPDFGAPENKKIPFPFPIFWKSLLPCGIQVWPTVAVAAAAQKGISLTEVGREGGGKEGSYYSISLSLCQSVGGWIPFLFLLFRLQLLKYCRSAGRIIHSKNCKWRRNRGGKFFLEEEELKRLEGREKIKIVARGKKETFLN